MVQANPPRTPSGPATEFYLLFCEKRYFHNVYALNIAVNMIFSFDAREYPNHQ